MSQVNPKQGVTDKVRLEKKATNTDITDTLGKILSMSWNINESSDRESDVNSGAEYRSQVDQLVTVDGSLTARIPDFKAFRLQGTYNTLSSTWEVNLTPSLPEFIAELQVESEKVLKLFAIKFGRGEYTVDKDGYLEATWDYQARVDASDNFSKFQDGRTLSDPGVQGYSKQGLDTEFSIGGTKVGSGTNFTMTYQRNLDADRGIEPNDGRPRRAPTQLVERLKDFTWNGEVFVTDMDPIKTALDTSSYPLVLQDRRSDITSELALADSTHGSVQFTGGRLNPFGGEVANDADRRRWDVEGNATGATITGDL